MRAAFTRLFAFLAAFAPTLLFAQGLLIDARPDVAFRLPRPMPPIIHPPIPRPLPEPPQTYKIKALDVNVTLADQVAKVQVSQSFVNTGSRQMEVSFVFPLPYDGAVDRLTFMVDGKEYDAKLLNATEARSIYESYMRRNIDPALMEWLGTGMFKTSVFPVPPGAERTVTMRYTQLCRKTNGLTELLFPLSTAKYTSQPVEKIGIRVAIQSQAKIKNIYSPTHQLDIQRPSNMQATASYTVANHVPTSDFRMFYDIGDEAVGASVLSYRPDGGDEGYFAVLVSPEIKRETSEVMRKTVLLVLDRSGSMSGKKIEQAKAALKFVLNNLHDGDLFNIVTYDNAVESFRPELQRFNDENRKLALGYVEGIYPGGSTNIDGALKSAFGQLQDSQMPSYVIFLTDGLPTAGETREPQIVQNAKERNAVRARVFSFGVGFDVNSRMLDKLARVGFGLSEYVRPSEDIEAHVTKLYQRIGAPAMTDFAMKVDLEGFGNPEQGSPVNRLYPKDAYDLFAGDQLVVVGRYKKAGAAKITVTGKVDGKDKSFDFPAQFTEKSNDETYAFVEKIWAMRRVGEIIDQIDLVGKNEELVKELVTLSTKHGILTPYTSFLAEEPGAFRELAANARRADVALDRLKMAEGKDGVAQRAFKGQAQAAAMAPGAGGVVLRDEADKRARVVQTVQNVGNKTFYQRGTRWVDSTVTEEQEKNVQKVERFSKDFFDLVAKHGKKIAPYLAMEGEVTVVLDGQAYAF